MLPISPRPAVHFRALLRRHSRALAHSHHIDMPEAELPAWNTPRATRRPGRVQASSKEGIPQATRGRHASVGLRPSPASMEGAVYSVPIFGPLHVTIFLAGYISCR